MAKRGFMELLGEEATEQLDAIRRYRVYQGKDNQEYRNRAKVALGVIGGYIRLRATEANEKTNELIERRLNLPTPNEQPRLLGRVNGSPES